MPLLVSPAVERAAATARTHAGSRPLTLGDWLLALIDDEESKPALLVRRVGVNLEGLVAHLRTEPGTAAPPDQTLFAEARSVALELTSDATITTDAMLLALLTWDSSFEPLGLSAARLRELLAPNAATITDDDPGPELVIGESNTHFEAARAIDANLNRAREALRVLDDYARFVRNDRVLTGELKRLRHDLAEAAQLLPANWLVASRDTLGDVGTSLSTSTESNRATCDHVAIVNLKRLQESLRSLEEFGKIVSTPFARQLEATRYAAYTLEKAFRTGSQIHARLAEARLYAILSGQACVAALDWTIEQIAEGGADVMQLREKNLSDRDLLHRARHVRRWTTAAGVLFIINDRPDIARLVGADGVHLGQDDLPVAEARRIIGPDALIGVSTHSPEQLRRAVLEGANYVGLGPTFPSATKSFEQFPGLDYVQDAVRMTPLPAFALGGISLKNIHEISKVGCGRVAVSSALTQVDEPGSVAAQLRQALQDTPLWRSGESEEIR